LATLEENHYSYCDETFRVDGLCFWDHDIKWSTGRALCST